MPDILHWFSNGPASSAVSLPFSIHDRISEWQKLRKTMLKSKPEAFTRDDWAYLISFLDSKNLFSVFQDSFGLSLDSPPQIIDRGYFLRPKGCVALWLPNNVSMLGPLTMILVSLSGNRQLIKAGSSANDLASAFYQFIFDHHKDPSLQTYFREHVVLGQFDRQDPRNLEMASQADVRLVFGSNEAGVAIDQMPHPVGSQTFAFIDKSSQAWMDLDAINDDTLAQLIKVFSIYGQAGCTSPKKLVIIGAKRQDADDVCQRMASLWSQMNLTKVQMHQASDNIMQAQFAAGLGWKSYLAKNNAGLLVSGDLNLLTPDGNLCLSVVAVESIDQALMQLPKNIQTIGFSIKSLDLKLLTALLLKQSSLKRLVPIAQMHHFSHVWDGFPYWLNLFEQVEVKF